MGIEIPNNNMKDVLDKTILEDKKHYKKLAENYVKSQTSVLMTSRFTDETKEQNERYKEKNKMKGRSLYGCPGPVSISVPLDIDMIVLEMNNDTNRIIGIGKVKNKPNIGTVNIYENRNYNRYKYVGKNNICREEMNEEEEILMRVFDNLCFKGNKHMKRGQGLKAFPSELLYRMSTRINLIAFLQNMFDRRKS